MRFGKLSVPRGDFIAGLNVGGGYEDKISPVVSVKPIGSSNRIEYRRNKITEWYLNSPLGLEQGFTLSAPPVSKTQEKLLVLEFQTRGELMPAVKGSRDAIEWKTQEGKRGTVLRSLRSPLRP